MKAPVKTRSPIKAKKYKAISAMSLFYHSIEGFVQRPLEYVNTHNKSTPSNAKMFSPVCNASSFTLKGNKMIRAHISRLLISGSPSAILLTVVPVNVYALNGSVFLTKSLRVPFVRAIHIFFEVLKKFPMVLYTPSSIVRVAFRCLGITTSVNMLPYAVEPSSRHPMFIVVMALSFMVNRGITFTHFLAEKAHRLVRSVPSLNTRLIMN